MNNVNTIVRDTAGRITSWRQGNLPFKVERDSDGRPTVVRELPYDLRNGCLRFSYDSDGVLTGMQGSGVYDPILGELLDDARQGGKSVVTSVFDPVTGGIVFSAGGEQIGGNAAPYAFTDRALAETDNGMTLVCASAQTATVNTGLPVGFGCAFKGAISFDGTATVTDVRTTGAENPWCALVQTGEDAYDVVGGKA